MSEAGVCTLELFWSDLVDVRLSEFDPVHSLQNSCTVFREDVGGQAILRVVSVVDCLVKAVYLENGYDRSEDLVLDKRRLLFHVLNDRRFEKPSLLWGGRLLSADDNSVSLFLRFLDETHAGVPFLFTDHRSKVRAQFQRVPELQISCHTHECWYKLVLDLLINVHPFRADTGLTAVPETSPDRALQRPRNVCVMPDNERCLPAQLQDQLWKMTRSVLHNRPSGIGTARHRNQSSNLVRHELIPHLRSTPSNNIHNPVWKASFLHQPHHLDRAERSIARWLRHNRISRNQCRSELPGDCRRWKVPRSNRRDHTDWESENHDGLLWVVAR